MVKNDRDCEPGYLYHEPELPVNFFVDAIRHDFGSWNGDFADGVTNLIKLDRLAIIRLPHH